MFDAVRLEERNSEIVELEVYEILRKWGVEKHTKDILYCTRVNVA
jgi:hypothetical protein